MSKYGSYEPVKATDTIDPVNCLSCGVLFGLARTYWEIKMKTGDPFKCPNGHEMLFPVDKT